MAQITVPPASNQDVWLAIADLAGSALDNIGHLNDVLDVPDVDQVDLDAALVTYNADPTAADAAWTQKFAAREIGRNQQRFGDDEVAQAVIEVMRIELNVLRASIPLPDITVGQMDGKVRAKIANP
ncbi:MAG: hypothetical protein KAJ19_28800 [Gammaproteobacteria bacterium]|nr:hypothetical protein [Gammaproteobacteria bacterium]